MSMISGNYRVANRDEYRGVPDPHAVCEEEIEREHFKRALSHYASGITVVTSHDAEGPVGFTCQSFYSLSVAPPLISFSVMKTSTSYPRIREGGRFAINVLSTSQKDVSNQFARKGTEKWKGIDWKLSGNGNPLITDSLLWLECSLYAEHEAGDHYLVIGRVHETHIDTRQGRRPLLYFKGDYLQLHNGKLT